MFSHRLVIVEGLYLALNDPPWSQVPFNALWCVQVEDWQIAHDRLVKRHQAAGLGKSGYINCISQNNNYNYLADNTEQARQRVEQNDQLNAQLLLSSYRPGTRMLRLLPE
jgi:pantothenate kinase